MDTVQKLTQPPDAPQAPTESVKAPELLKYLQNEYITFCASSGISQDEDGNFITMTVKQFAAAAGVSRQTLYNWQKSIPNFWTLVDERARQIFNQSTKFAIMKALKLKAMAGGEKAAEMVLSHYSDYRPPAQAHDIKLSGWGDMVREARKNSIKADRPKPKPVEGEIVTSVSSSPPKSSVQSTVPSTPVIGTPQRTEQAAPIAPPVEPPNPVPNPFPSYSPPVPSQPVVP